MAPFNVHESLYGNKLLEAVTFGISLSKLNTLKRKV